MSTTDTSSLSSDSLNTTFIFQNANSSIIRLLSGQQAINELQKIDDYIANFSQFDLQCRLNVPNATADDYCKFIRKQILNWDKESSQAMASCIEFINTNYEEELKLLRYPPEIYVVLTNGKDENNAPYCRNENVIVMPRSTVILRDMYKIFIHELFHIWSRWPSNAKIRDKLYENIGYYKIPVEKSIEFPADLQKTKITNPDAPFVLKYYIKLKKIGHKTKKTYTFTPILQAAREFNPRFSLNLFDYFKATTLILDDVTYEPLEPLQYLAYREASNFFDQVGHNTTYIIHPEEMLADQFVLWMTSKGKWSRLQSPMVVSKMADTLASAVKRES